MNDNAFEAPRDPSFPPLFQAQAVPHSVDPFDKACALATLGCDSGTLLHCLTPERLRAAIVFAPEVPLEQAMQALCACAVGFQNAFGALAPPEVALHLTWAGGILVNGANSGGFRVAAALDDPETVPDWLVVGLEARLTPPEGEEPGDAPDQTCLYLEGCAGISPLDLLEGWARHTLVLVNGLSGGEVRALHSEWRELLYGVGSDVALDVAGQPLTGTFLGVDANFAMLLRTGADTKLIPLNALLGESS